MPFVNEAEMNSLQQSTLEAYVNEYWTRVVPVEDYLPNVHDKHPLGTDMAYAMDVLWRMDPETLPPFEPKFDPQAFQTQHE